MSGEDPYVGGPAPAARQPRQVAIFGSATTALRSAPTEGWEVWSIGLYDRGDAARLFEMHHDPVILRAEDGGRLAGLQRAECPVYMQREWPEIPRSVAYPKEDIRRALDLPDMDLFAGTACYMLAMAVAELSPGDVIGLFGLELLHDSAHGGHRPALWALRVAAKAKGIKVTVAPESTLFRGVDYGTPEPLGMTVEALLAMKDEYTRQRDRARTEVHTFNGALQAIEAVLERQKHGQAGGKVIW
jgi:hypothetical protein